MVLELNATTFEKLRRQNTEETVVELWKITLESTPLATTVLPLVGLSEPIAYEGVTYLPFPMSRVGLPQDSAGTIQTAQIDLSNADRRIVAFLEDPDTTSVLGQDVRLKSVLYSETLLQLTIYESLWTISSAQVDNNVVSLQLETAGLGSEDIPTDRYRRGGCRWRYRSQECGYEPDPNGDPRFLTCDYSLAACIERGDDEVSRGLPRQHPQQFGAFPSLLRRVV